MNILKKLPTMPCTLSIIAVWIAIWIAVTVKNVSPFLSGKGIAKIGNEYYRIYTAGLTHTNLIHLLVNVSAMFWAGYLYEGHIGSVKFLLVGTICAVIAQFLFICIYRNTDGSIGGSVYIFALCGFCLTSQLLSPNFPELRLGTWGGNWLAVYLIASNIPILFAPDLSALVIHGIAFAIGGLAALGCWLLGAR